MLFEIDHLGYAIKSLLRCIYESFSVIHHVKISKPYIICGDVASKMLIVQRGKVCLFVNWPKTVDKKREKYYIIEIK